MIEVFLSYWNNNALFGAFNVLALSILTLYLNYKLKVVGVVLSLFVYAISFYLIGDFKIFLLCIVAPALIITYIGLFLVKPKESKIEDSPFRVEIITNKKEKIYIPEINTGVAVLGASGSGKSASAIFFLLKHFATKKFAGVFYDYKNYELTELAYPLFKDLDIDFKVFALHDVNRSIRINPIAPEFMISEAHINSIVTTLLLNLSQSENESDTGKFFQDGAESLISAVIWRLKTEYPEKCNLPFVVAFLLSADNHHKKIYDKQGNLIMTEPYRNLVDWICKDQRAEILGSVFLTGITNPKQTASLYSTLAANLRKIASPEIFYLLGSNDISLALNSDNNRTVLAVVNNPSTNENAFTPILATIIDSCLTHMSVRGRKPSFALIDEAPTIKIMNLARRIATLRSFGLAFVYCVQDKVQSVAQWSGKEYKMKEIFTNLSTIFFGKVNDPDTAKFYERYFELIEKEQTSVSKGKSDIFSPSDKGGTRVTTSKKEQSKIRSYEFFQLQKGEFVMMNGGKDTRFRFYYDENQEKKIPYPSKEVTPTELETNYLEILEQAKNFLK
jgi:type IV secretory pathway TraG/TraD family ATPase VirD4